MKANYKILNPLLIIIIFFPLISLSQIDMDLTHLEGITPEVAEFHVLNHYENDFVTGSVGINIPLCNIESVDLSTGISLNYNTKGIKVRTISSNFGTNWSLSGGGMITRVIKGRFKDLEDGVYNNTLEPVNTKGFAKHNEELDCGIPSGTIFDFERDLFIVSAPGLNSEFVIDGGSIIVTGGDFIETGYVYEGDVIRYTLRGYGDNDYEFIDNGFTTTDIKSITIVSSNGTQFFFEEYSYGTFGRSAEIQNWYLTKMRSPNGDYIYYSYETIGKDVFLNDCKTTIKIPDINDCPTNNLLAYIDEYDFYAQVSQPILLHSNKYLSQITGDFGFVKFIYNHSREDVLDAYALSSMQIFGINGEEREIYFDYEYLKYNEISTRLLLKTIRNIAITGTEQKYYFNYNIGSFPDYTSFKYDYSGYYSNNSQTDKTNKVWAYFRENTNSISYRDNDIAQTVFYPFLINPTSDYDVFEINPSASDRRPNINDCKIGMLSKITYPTGGILQLEYELNDFPVYKISVPINTKAKGMGLRVKSQILEDGNGNFIRKHYEYFGARALFPSYAYLNCSFSCIDINAPISEKKDFIKKNTAIKQTSGLNTELINGSSVYYTMVKEQQENNGEITYYFSFENDTPPIYDPYNCGYYENGFYFNPPSKWPFMPYSSKKNMRGLLLEKWFSNEAGKYIKAEIFNYNYLEYKNGAPLKGYNKITFEAGIKYSMESIVSYYELPKTKAVLKDKYIIESENDIEDVCLIQPGNHDINLTTINNGINTAFVSHVEYGYATHSFYYNWQKVNETHTLSNGNVKEYKFFYPYGLNGTAYEAMEAKHMNIPVKEVEKYNDKITLIKQTFYSDITGNSSVFQQKLLPSKISVSTDGTELLRPIMIYDKYNIKTTRLLQAHKENDINVSYIWDNKGKNIILKAVNASFNELEGGLQDVGLSVSNIQKDVYKYGDNIENEKINSINTLREHMPNQNIYSYTYNQNIFSKPSSITSPNKKTLYYSYDDLGRLNKITDSSEKNIIKYIEYNMGEVEVSASTSHAYKRYEISYTPGKWCEVEDDYGNCEETTDFYGAIIIKFEITDNLTGTVKQYEGQAYLSKDSENPSEEISIAFDYAYFDNPPPFTNTWLSYNQNFLIFTRISPEVNTDMGRFDFKLIGFQEFNSDFLGKVKDCSISIKFKDYQSSN